MPDVSVVVLTMGDRAVAVAEAIVAVRAQRGIDAEVIVVWNGATPHDVDADIEILLEENGLFGSEGEVGVMVARSCQLGRPA